MGNAQDRSRPNVEYESASRMFSQSELEDLKKVYASLAEKSDSTGKLVTASGFQDYFGLRGSLATRLFNVVTKKREDGGLYFEDLIIAKAALEKGAPSEIEDFIFQLLDSTGDGKVRRTDFEAMMTSILETILAGKDVQDGPFKDIVQAFVNGAEFTVESETRGEMTISRQNFQKFCTHTPSVKKFLGSLLTTPTMGSSVRQLPSLLVPEGVEHLILLRKEYAWHIAGPLQQQAQKWSLVYNSSINGLSLSTFLGIVSLVQGSTVIVIKDKEGCIYGGYASQPWEKHSNFYGDMKSFLFTLHPKISLYQPTGFNANLQWAAFNYISESIPNGIGFGGQIHHFGLFLSAGFDSGHTYPSPTFDNPALSTREAIIPDTLECWAVGMKADNDTPGQSDSLKGKGTVLERFKEDRQMLNMVGIANASESVG